MVIMSCAISDYQQLAQKTRTYQPKVEPFPNAFFRSELEADCVDVALQLHDLCLKQRVLLALFDDALLRHLERCRRLLQLLVDGLLLLELVLEPLDLGRGVLHQRVADVPVDFSRME